MEGQTFINQMKARGYETTPPSLSGNVTATKGDITVRLVPLANYLVYIKTPAMTAIIRDSESDDETLRMVDVLTA